MINNTTNPASIRSKDYLVKALLELMEEKSYDKISIKEITDKALLSRRTFYTNFQVKDDIMSYYISSLLEEFIEILKGYKTITKNQAAKEYFNYWFKHKKLLKLLKRNNLLILIQLFENFIVDMPKQFSENHNPCLKSEVPLYEAAFLAGGLWNMLNLWIDKDFKNTPEEITNIFIQIFK